MFKDRATVDVVVILLAIMVGAVMVVAIVGLLVMKLIHPGADTKEAATLLGSVLTTIVGALVGFVGGRATGKMEAANGNGSPKRKS